VADVRATASTMAYAVAQTPPGTCRTTDLTTGHDDAAEMVMRSVQRIYFT
jgi:hypothetical protein